MTRMPMANNPYVGVRATSAQTELASALLSGSRQRDHSGDPYINARDPAQDIKGMPPNFGDGILPHVLTFQGLISTISRVYRASDEALKNSFENARFMRNDTAIMECLEQRQRSCCLLDWHLEPEDEKDTTQEWLANEVTAILKQTPRFMQYRENLMHALWYGKYAVQHRYRWKKVKGQWRVVIDRWLPVNGDKLVFRYDDGTREHDPDQIGIRVGAGFTARSGVDKPWASDRAEKVEATDYGLAMFLEPWERDLLAIHKHMIEDGEYEAPENAGRIHGVGIRSRIYWLWFQKQEALAWMMEYLERSAFGIEIWYYPWGNPEAEKKTRTAAEERVGLGRNIILVPRPMGEEGMAYGVERIEPGMAGLESLKQLVIEYFGHLIKRYILGQTLTTEAESTGLGSNLASVHLDTYLQIVRYDASNLEETLTTDLVKPLLAYNYPNYADVPLRFKIETEVADVEARLAGARQAYDIGCRLKEADVMELIGMETPKDEDVALQNPSAQQIAMGMPPGQDGLGGNGQFGQQRANPLVHAQGSSKGLFKGFTVPQAKFDTAGEPISEDSEREKLKRYDELEAAETAENMAKEEKKQAKKQGQDVSVALNAAMDGQLLKTMVNLGTEKQENDDDGTQTTQGTELSPEGAEARPTATASAAEALNAAMDRELVKQAVNLATGSGEKYTKGLDLGEWLYRYGYGRDDSTKIAKKYRRDGITQAVQLMAGWDDQTHNYTAELREAINQWESEKYAAEFHESEHPRDVEGKFAEKEGGDANLRSDYDTYAENMKQHGMEPRGFDEWKEHLESVQKRGKKEQITTEHTEKEPEKFSLTESRMSEQFQRAYFHCDTIEASNRFWGSQTDGELLDLQGGDVLKYTRRHGMVSCEHYAKPFDESEHPRDNDGQFASKEGQSAMSQHSGESRTYMTLSQSRKALQEYGVDLGKLPTDDPDVASIAEIHGMAPRAQVPAKVANMVHEQLTHLSQRTSMVGLLAGKLTIVAVDNRGSGAAGATFTTSDGRRYIIAIDPVSLRGFADPEGLFVDGTPSGVIRHELAHALQYAMAHEGAERDIGGPLRTSGYFPSKYAEEALNYSEQWAEFITEITGPDFDVSTLPEEVQESARRFLK